MNGYFFSLRCRWCGGECEHLTGSDTGDFDTRAVAKCVSCTTEWLVIVQMVDPTNGRRKLTPEKLASMAKARARKIELGVTNRKVRAV